MTRGRYTHEDRLSSPLSPARRHALLPRRRHADDLPIDSQYHSKTVQSVAVTTKIQFLVKRCHANRMWYCDFLLKLCREGIEKKVKVR